MALFMRCLTSLPRFQILFLLEFKTTRLKLPNTISAYKFCLIWLSLCTTSPTPSSLLLKLLYAPSLSLSLSMAETNATVNQKKIDDCYMPLVHSNSSSINIDDSLSGVDDPIPIIDFSMLISDDPDKQFKTTQDLRNACLEYGSFMVRKSTLKTSSPLVYVGHI